MSALDPEAARWAETRRLLDGALERRGPARADWLAAACPDDPALAAEVAALAAAHDDADASDAFEHAWAGSAPSRSGETLGAWRLAERLGAGGMGEVYAAARADGQFEQQAAVKLLYPGSAPISRRRFLAERQTLARLDHPGIARLLDGGLADDATPFLVMERVRGVPVTEWADAQGLDVEARVRLFLGACDAVGYAHRHLVVHRDLKPAHILVEPPGTTGAPPRVVLLDFGIARLLDAPTGLHTTHAAPMTPAWAAPEQRAGDPATTATDVHGLGLVLYALLTGEPPAGTAATVVPPSRTAPDERRRRLRGDLDTIVLRALAPEPERRYETATALADDLRRYLAHEPVRARPDSPAYRVRRFVRRNRAAVLGAALAVLALAVGLGVALGQAARARDAADRAQATLAFLQNTLYTAEPVDGAPEATIREALDRAAEQAEAELGGQPLVAAGVHASIGYTYLNLGLADRAETHHRRAADLYARAGRRYALERGMELGNLAQAVEAQGRVDEALPLFEQALSLQTAHGTVLDRASVLNAYGAALDGAGETDRAEATYREAIRIWNRADAPQLPLALNNLAVLYESTRRSDEAVPLVEQAVRALYRAGPDERPRLGAVLTTLGTLYDYTGRPQAADSLDAALAILTDTHGADHPRTILALASRALVDVRAGRAAAAVPRARDAAARAARVLPPGDPTRLHTEAIAAHARCDLSPMEASAALPMALATLDARRALYGDDHTLTAVSESIVGICHAALGQRADAERRLSSALRVLRDARGDADARTRDVSRRLNALRAGSRPA